MFKRDAVALKVEEIPNICLGRFCDAPSGAELFILLKTRSGRCVDYSYVSTQCGICFRSALLRGFKI